MLTRLLPSLDNHAEAQKDRATDLAKPADPLAIKAKIHSVEEEVLANIAATYDAALPNHVAATIIAACPLSRYAVARAEFISNLALPLFGAVKIDASLHSPAQLLGTEAEGDVTYAEVPRTNHPVLEVKFTQALLAHAGNTNSSELQPTLNGQPTLHAAIADQPRHIAFVHPLLRIAHIF
ncbi:hypothetical protein L7F22_068610 [Adiantum nelumboides]|nr:hypothetical protein [Adiantum nelumboides]